MLGKVRLALWALVGVAALAGIYLSLQPKEQALPAPQSIPMKPVGGDFTLTNGEGHPFGSAQLAGKPYAIFFGFTHCPDVCPTTLARLVRLRNQLGKGNDAFNVVFVTVDPERDGPKEVGAYGALFGAPVIGLTGTPAQIAAVKDQFGIFSEKDGDGANYNVNHTATALLMDGRGQFVATIAPEEGDAVALAKVQRMVGN